MREPGRGRIAATFIVRLWAEDSQGHVSQWRGQVEHVQSGIDKHFRDLEQLPKIIAWLRGNNQERRPADSANQDLADDTRDESG
ncbi:MAG: hypothetical protein R3300_03440 [Candidatus Promineifilaceae bacterium]|nr:hypothetical protein [Candidatus Promineifilaceae bacterium]